MELTRRQKKQILSAIRKRILKSHFNVAGIDYQAWFRSYDARSSELLDADRKAFEAGVQEVLRDLRSSHTGFYHERPTRLFPQHTINATLGKLDRGAQPQWFFLDIFEDGPADLAGIQRGDVLIAVDGVEYAPPTMPPLKTGAEHVLSVSAPDGSAARQVSIKVPARKGNRDRPPMIPPKAISTSLIGPGTGLLRITWFPGSMGLEFSRSLDTAISDLKSRGCERLILDLRGNIGGGLGFARLASYLCPDKRPIGFSVTPKRQRAGYKPETFEQVVYPGTRLGFATTLARFAVRDKSIFLLTQGLGAQPFHGRIAILVNEWTNSAAEMVASFASENKLAIVVGTKTAGNVLGAVNVKVGGGYWLRLPVFGWYTDKGTCIEGHGVEPDYQVESDAWALSRGVDRQLEEAVDLLAKKDPRTDEYLAQGANV